MSRHEIPALDSKNTVVVGWDAPMNTYFAHVKDTTIKNKDKQIFLWLGGDFDEIQTVGELSTKLQDYVVISDEIVRELMEDKRLRRM